MCNLSAVLYKMVPSQKEVLAVPHSTPISCPYTETCEGISSQKTYKGKISCMTMKRQWAYGLTELPWNDHFHTSLVCFMYSSFKCFKRQK